MWTDPSLAGRVGGVWVRPGAGPGPVSAMALRIVRFVRERTIFSGASKG